MRHLCRGLSALLVASVMLAAMPLQAGAQSNDADITITGGNARAVAVCLNLAKERGWGRVKQTNKCDNLADALGGTVTLKNVKVAVAQINKPDNKKPENKKYLPRNSVTLTISGGDATAVAACVNAASEKGPGGIVQNNQCVNTAIATGGNVVLENVVIKAVQVN